MKHKFSARVKEIISFSREEAIRLGNDFIGPEHLLLSLFRNGENQPSQILRNDEINLPGLIEELERALKNHSGDKTRKPNHLPLSLEAELVIRRMVDEIEFYPSPYIEPEHLLLSLLENDGYNAPQVLKQFGVDYDWFSQKLKTLKRFEPSTTGVIEKHKAEEKEVKPVGRVVKNGGFSEIFRFEIKYRLKRPDTYLYFLSFFIIVTLAFANGAVPENDQVFVNSPIVLFKFFSVFSLFMMVVSAAIMGAPLYRDLEYNTHEYYLAYPISQNGYFWGRFLGSFLFVLIIGSTLVWGSVLGIFLGPKLGWLAAGRAGPFHWIDFVQPFIAIALPNLLLTSAVFFGLVAHTRNNKVIYSGGVIFYLLYTTSVFAVHFLANKNMAFYLDAFGFTPIALQEQYLNPEQLNHLRIGMHGMILLNRILWGAVGLSIILFTWSRFSFVRFFSGRPFKKDRTILTGEKRDRNRKVPKVKVEFARGYHRRVILALTKIEWLSIVRDNYFRLILGVGMLFLVFLFWMGDGDQYNVPELPRTVMLMSIYNENFLFFIFLILLFYTGEVVHREKSQRFAIINDSLPPPDWVFYASKLIALFFLTFLMASLPMLAAVCIQLSKGYTRLNLPIYFISCYGLSLPMFIEMIFFAFTVHVLINNKFAAHAVALFIWVLMILGVSTGRFDYRLLLYSYTPAYWMTDMDGLGPSTAPQVWFNLYWIIAGSLLVLFGAMFYCRGTVANFGDRSRLALHRFTPIPRVVAFVLLISFLVTAGYNYYNVSYLNSWLTHSERNQRAATYEEQLKKYENLPLPGITRLRLFMDIYPKDRRMVTKALVTIINANDRPISRMLIDGDQLTEYSIQYNGKPMVFNLPLIFARPKFTFFKRGMDTSMYRLYEFPEPLQPGDTALVEIHSLLSNNGFTNNFSGISAQHNGTSFDSYLPDLGYDVAEELRANSIRKEYGLPPKKDDELPLPDDPAGFRRLFSRSLSNLVDFEATVSTSSDQLGIAPGILDSTWVENTRKYFHYALHNPKNYSPFPVLSARYTVIHDSVKLPGGRIVGIEFDYHHDHSANLGRFLLAFKDGLYYFSSAFGKYPLQSMRLIEGPAFFQSNDFPNSIAYGEDFAWNAEFTNSNQFDYCYFFTSYHLGLQWWMFQVAPNYTQGAPTISEGLSKYGAYMLYQKRFGITKMREIIHDETWRYIISHRYEFRKETPLILANRNYIWNTKAGLILYELSDLIGEDSLNAVLREFRNDWAYRTHPPYAGGNDLYRIIQKHVPDSLQYYLTDSWQKITIYDNKILEASAIPVGKNNEFRVHIKVGTGKTYTDSLGNDQLTQQMNDLIDIGIFDEESHPLYLKKQRFKSGEETIDIVVKGKPVKVGIDPYGKLIDRVPEDNMKHL